ncbi:hypothetical protein AVEN_60009-1 [Araneus ventricosus]|uniref:Uncharacterized protein n=1 Tax=Araneus ventricosus TaxID=182803 RepID=A0A4Y2CCY0_ARAVE|nr:hypothetical protein AVEN_60009-1 [Araneus ventricosus]
MPQRLLHMYGAVPCCKRMFNCPKLLLPSCKCSSRRLRACWGYTLSESGEELLCVGVCEIHTIFPPELVSKYPVTCGLNPNCILFLLNVPDGMYYSKEYE